MPKAEASEHGLVRPAGIEPATPAFGGQYSIRRALKQFIKMVKAFAQQLAPELVINERNAL